MLTDYRAIAAKCPPTNPGRVRLKNIPPRLPKSIAMPAIAVSVEGRSGAPQGDECQNTVAPAVGQGGPKPGWQLTREWVGAIAGVAVAPAARHSPLNAGVYCVCDGRGADYERMPVASRRSNHTLNERQRCITVPRDRRKNLTAPSLAIARTPDLPMPWLNTKQQDLEP